MVKSSPKGDDEARLMVQLRSDTWPWSGYGGPAGREGRSHRMLVAEGCGTIPARSNLGDDRVRPEPHDRMIGLLDQERFVKAHP
jgi:hypothetical protein